METRRWFQSANLSAHLQAQQGTLQSPRYQRLGVEMIRRSHSRFIDAAFVGLLILYLLAGITAAPFHGDESTIIHKSRDWFLLAQGKLATLLYSATPVEPAEQELRLVNGVVSW